MPEVFIFGFVLGLLVGVAVTLLVQVFTPTKAEIHKNKSD